MRSPTQGPWRLDDAERHHNLSDEYHAIDAGQGFYAGPHIGGFCLTGFMTRADAQLIAAAPELYDAADMALNALIGCCVAGDGVDDRKTMLEAQAMLRAAIRKATVA